MGVCRFMQFRIVEYSDFNPSGQAVPENPLACQDDGECDTPRPSADTSTPKSTTDPVARFHQFECAADPVPVVPTPADEAILACSPPKGTQGAEDYAPAAKYYLGPAEIVGGVIEAEAFVPDGQVNWVVSIQLSPTASAEFLRISRDLVGTERQFAIVLHGVVVTAPTWMALSPAANWRSPATSPRTPPTSSRPRWHPRADLRCRQTVKSGTRAGLVAAGGATVPGRGRRGA